MGNRLGEVTYACCVFILMQETAITCAEALEFHKRDDNLTLTCNVNNYDSTLKTVNWRKNGTKWSLSKCFANGDQTCKPSKAKRYTFESNNKGFHMTIHHANQSDVGTYMCTNSNDTTIQNFTFCFCEHNDFLLQTTGTLLDRTRKIEVHQFTKGANVRINCSLDHYNYDVKHVRWKQFGWKWPLATCYLDEPGGCTSSDDRYFYERDKDGIYLMMHRANISDLGLYMCIDPSENIIGNFTVCHCGYDNFVLLSSFGISMVSSTNNQETSTTSKITEKDLNINTKKSTPSISMVSPVNNQKTLVICVIIGVVVTIVVSVIGIWWCVKNGRNVIRCARNRWNGIWRCVKNGRNEIYMHVHGTEMSEDSSQSDIETWKDDGRIFCQTEAATDIYNLLKAKRVVIVSGLPGSGKSINARHIALDLKKKMYRLFCVNSIKQMKEEILKFGKDEKQVYVFDDIFGREVVSQENVDEFKDAIEICSKNSNILMLCTSRSYILENVELSHLKSKYSQRIIKISQVGQERVKIFEKHAVRNDRPNLLKDNVSKIINESDCPVGCLTLLCSSKFEQNKTEEFLEEFFKIRRRHIKSDVDISGRLLYESVCNNDKETSRFLIKHGSDLDHCDKLGKSVLYQSLCNWDYETSKMLVEVGADVKKYDKNGISPLFISVSKNQYSLSELILLHSANVNQSNKAGESPLYMAVLKDYEKLTELLIKYGADVNKCDQYGKSPLYLAVSNGNFEICKLLINKNADVNRFDENGRSPLYLSVSNENRIITTLLRTKGADVNQRDNLGKSPLTIAQSYPNPEIYELLI